MNTRYKSRRASLFIVVLATALLGMTQNAVALQILIKNVNIFDGKNGELAMGQSVLVENNLIKTISAKPISVSNGIVVIDGKGRTLMPGLIDGHAHVMINQSFSTIEANLDVTDLAFNVVGVVLGLWLYEWASGVAR